MHIYRRTDLEKILGISRSTIYAWIKTGQFPSPIKLGQRAIGWHASDIEAWLAARNVSATPRSVSSK